MLEPESACLSLLLLPVPPAILHFLLQLLFSRSGWTETFLAWERIERSRNSDSNSVRVFEKYTMSSTAVTATTSNLLILLYVLFTTATATTLHHHRHLLHQPFFPQTTTIPPAQPPSLSPQSQPKFPSSSIPNTPQKPFFPTLPSPPPPAPSAPTLATFPANISSIIFPHHSSSSHRTLVLTVSISLSILFAAVLTSLSAFFIYSRRSHHYDASTSYKAALSDSLRLSPSNAATSDGCPPKPPKIPPRPGVPNTSSEFLYLGTLVNSRNGIEDTGKVATLRNTGVRFGVQSPPYQKLGSPELRPLPPLPRHNYTPSYRSGEVLLRPNENDGTDTDAEEEEFFSPRESSGRKEAQEQSALHVESSSRIDNFGSRSFNSRTASYPYSNSYSPTNSVSSTSSPMSNQSPSSNKSKSSDTIVNFPAPVECLKRPTPSLSPSSSRGGSSGTALSSPEQNLRSLERNKQSLARMEAVPPHFLPLNLPPPPPPLPPPRFWEFPVETRMAQEVNLGPGSSGPPVLVAPSRPVLVQSHAMPILANEQSLINGSVEKSEETAKPKLKPLHWDKVRASSNRAMVWDQLKSSSFQLNEEMIETLFMVNNSNANTMDNNARRQSLPLLNRENRVLDPKKSQNIAILLRALNVTIDEVCEALWEGNSDNLGTELLESLLKMAPTKEEERKLKEFKDESPFKLGPAEKFLKAVLDIPFAFKRIDAMLYISNFDSEVEYLRRSLETLQAACEELRNSRIFLRLLEAVLKTGNRMNVGTNRGDAQAFKLDTLLKLVDVKGTDGKTTLLHFVVQEIIRSEGSRLSGGNQNQGEDKVHQTTSQDDVEFRKLGLQVVSGLSGELNNVKKAAAMESDALTGEVAKLASGIAKIHEVLKLNNEISLKETSWKFSESMNAFLKKAEEEIARIQAQERVAQSLVKETTEYFHGNSAKEEARPFRIFMVVRDFLSILDHVCREVGKINERTIYSSVRPMPLNPYLGPVFPGLGGRQHAGALDDESLFAS